MVLAILDVKCGGKLDAQGQVLETALCARPPSPIRRCSAAGPISTPFKTDLTNCVCIVAVIFGLCHLQCYMSPEMLRRDRYNSKCDMWSVGCILKEMTYGLQNESAPNIQQLFSIINITVGEHTLLAVPFFKHGWICYTGVEILSCGGTSFCNCIRAERFFLSISMIRMRSFGSWPRQKVARWSRMSVFLLPFSIIRMRFLRSLPPRKVVRWSRMVTFSFRRCESSEASEEVDLIVIPPNLPLPSTIGAAWLSFGRGPERHGGGSEGFNLLARFARLAPSGRLPAGSPRWTYLSIQIDRSPRQLAQAVCSLRSAQSVPSVFTRPMCLFFLAKWANMWKRKERFPHRNSFWVIFCRVWTIFQKKVETNNIDKLL